MTSDEQYPLVTCHWSLFLEDPRMPESESKPDWKNHGVRVVHAGELDTNTPQTPGMNRAAAITHARAGASKLWAGTVKIHPNAKTGAHHHGELGQHRTHLGRRDRRASFAPVAA